MPRASGPHECRRAAIAVAVLSAVNAAGAAPTVSRHTAFEMTLEGNVMMTVSDMTQRIEADTAIRYTWAQNDDERLLTVDALSTSTEIDGIVNLDIMLDGTKIVETIEGVPYEVLRADAPPEAQAMLQDSFATPLCRIKVDDGLPTGHRDVTARPGADLLIENGLISNAMLFHPPYERDTPTWTAAGELSMGNGNFARGPLTYTRVDDAPRGTVEVTGTLTAKRTTASPGTSITMRNARYVVTGRQTYDEARGEWVSGTLRFNVSFDLLAGEEEYGQARGTMRATLETRATKPALSAVPE